VGVRNRHGGGRGEERGKKKNVGIKAMLRREGGCAARGGGGCGEGVELCNKQRVKKNCSKGRGLEGESPFCVKYLKEGSFDREGFLKKHRGETARG